MAGRQDPHGGRPGWDQPEIPAARGRFRRRWWWAVPCGGVALAGTAAAFILSTGGSPGPSGFESMTSQVNSGVPAPGSASAHPAAAAIRTGSAPVRPGSTPPAPAHPAGSPAHAAPASPQVRASLRSWAAGRGGTALALVSRQLGTCAQAGGLARYLVMKQACAQLGAAVATADAGPAIPETAMQHRYARALATLAAAADHCRAAISVHLGDESATTSVNQAMLRRARAGLAAGASELYLATSQIKLRS